MMQGMRKAGQTWLGKAVITVMFGFLIVSFAIWGIGDIFRGGPQNTVARVGDTEITVDRSDGGTARFRVDSIETFYGPIQALKKVSMHINEGETVSLIGANGAGKSTLLMSIFGQPRAASGQIVYRGTDITRKSSHYIASNGIAQSPRASGWR